jgi:hypothetical protein
MIYRPQNFRLFEFVCPEVYNKFGDMAWQFFDEKVVITLDWVRRTLNKPIIVNTWHEGGEFDERGLRCIQCKIVRDKCMQGQVYVSPHILGKAFDFDVQGMDAAEVRVWLAANKDKIPYAIRLENNVNWVHLDCEDTGVKVQIFNP